MTSTSTQFIFFNRLVTFWLFDFFSTLLRNFVFLRKFLIIFSKTTDFRLKFPTDFLTICEFSPKFFRKNHKMTDFRLIFLTDFSIFDRLVTSTFLKFENWNDSWLRLSTKILKNISTLTFDFRLKDLKMTDFASSWVHSFRCHLFAGSTPYYRLDNIALIWSLQYRRLDNIAPIPSFRYHSFDTIIIYWIPS